MAVRFRCQKCQQWLSASSRKRGRKAKCPKCKNVVTVPTQEEIKDAPSNEADKSMPVMIVYDDEPALPVKTKPLSPLIQAAASQREGADYDYRRISISRRVVYIQALLLVVVLAFAFTSGYFWSRKENPTNEQPETPANNTDKPTVINNHAGNPAENDPSEKKNSRFIQLTGKLSFIDPFGFRSPDSGAVVIAFAQDKLPGDLLPIKGLSPLEPEPTKDDVSLEALDSQGGAYCRTNHEGLFQLIVQPGNYYVLVISHQTRRPKDQSLEPDDLEVLTRYFKNPQQLIGQNKYRWFVADLKEEMRIHLEFGKSGF